MSDDHDTAAEIHHHETHDDVAEARAAVSAAVEAVTAADEKMDGLIAMLGRHFRLGVVAVGAAVIVGLGLIYVINEIRQQSEVTALQAVINEVEVLRHRVNSKESDERLCSVALGVRYGAEEAKRICAPVLGDEYRETKAKLEAEERRLAELRKK